MGGRAGGLAGRGREGGREGGREEGRTRRKDNRIWRGKIVDEGVKGVKRVGKVRRKVWAYRD